MAAELPYDKASSAFTSKDFCDMITVCESCERWEDMCQYLRLYLGSTGNDLKEKEDVNLLSVGFKNLVSPLRTRMRMFDEVEDSDLKKEYRASALEELKARCTEVTDMLGNDIIPKRESDASLDGAKENLVNLYKMQGDYFRYICEHLAEDSDERKALVEKARKAYEKAFEYCKDLPETDPSRLGLALNRSVFHFEIAKETQIACDMAKQAFDMAIAKLDSLGDKDYKDSTLIMQLLRDNLTIWNQHNDKTEEIED